MGRIHYRPLFIPQRNALIVTAKDVEQANEQAILTALREKYPDVLAISAAEALAVSGASSAGDRVGAARTAIQRKTFPFPVKKINGRNIVLLTDIARTLAAAPPARLDR